MLLDAGVTLQGVQEVAISNNLFSGITKNSLTLMGSSHNSIIGNRFESATKSCLVIGFDSKSKQLSNENIFQFNYFTHNPEKTTDQIILSNQNSFLRSLRGINRISARNRFVNCAFEETAPEKLKHVIVDYSSWKTVEDHGPSLIFEDCYFKRGDRRVSFISFLIVNKGPDLGWYWDELLNDTWVASNVGYALTGHKKNEYTQLIQFTDGNKDGLVLEAEYPFDARYLTGTLLPEQANQPPELVRAFEDIAVYRNSEPDTINLFEVFEDDMTADENLDFTISCDNTSLVSVDLENGLLTLNYAAGAVGMALVKIIVTDDG